MSSSTYTRSEHYRTNAYGTTFRVREHTVRRDHWNVEWIAQFYGSPAYRAADLLRRRSVGRGAQGCFVNPNAKCPVCGVPVFFYANSFGSRVYFDDLGPPWPKHPCTDYPRARRPLVHDTWRPITRRKSGDIQELIDAGNTLGFLKNKQFGVRARSDWSLIVVEEAARSGERTDVKGSLIDSRDGTRIQFYCFSVDPLFEPGDLISVAGSEFSFVSKETLVEVRFRIGDRISSKDGTVIVERSAEVEQSAPRKTPVKSRSFDPSLYGSEDWSNSLWTHYQSKNLAKEKFLKLATKPVTILLQGGARTPYEFADGLNRVGFKTAAGTPWTSLLARFLIRFIAEQQKSEHQAARRGLTKKHLGKHRLQKIKNKNKKSRGTPPA